MINKSCQLRKIPDLLLKWISIDMVGFKGLLGHLNPLQSQDPQVLHCPQSSTAISSLCPSQGFSSGLNICYRLWTKTQGFFSQSFICKLISTENINNSRSQLLSGTIFSLLAVESRSSDVKKREMHERQVDPGIQQVTFLRQGGRDRSWLLGTFMNSSGTDWKNTMPVWEKPQFLLV